MKRKLAGVLTTFFAALIFVGGAGPAYAEDIKFSLEWLVGGRHVGFFVALEKGYYRDEGLNVTISRGYGSGDTVKRVATGSADLGIADTTTVLSARANNATPVVMVATFFNGGPEAILALKSSGIKEPKDLSGKKVGGGSTSASLKLLQALASKTGLKDYKTVPMASDQIYPALLTKQVDAITGFTDNAAVIASRAQQNGDDVVVLPYSDYGIQNYGSAIIVKADRVAKQDPAIAKFLNASLKGIAWALANPKEAVAIMKKHAPITDEAVALRTWEIDRDLIVTPETKKFGLGSMQPERMESTYQMAKTYLGLEKEIDLKAAYTSHFLPKPAILP